MEEISSRKCVSNKLKWSNRLVLCSNEIEAELWVVRWCLMAVAKQPALLRGGRRVRCCCRGQGLCSCLFCKVTELRASVKRAACLTPFFSRFGEHLKMKCISCDCNGSRPQNEKLWESETDVSFSLVLVCSGRISGINFESLIQMEKVKFNVEWVWFQFIWCRCLFFFSKELEIKQRVVHTILVLYHHLATWTNVKDSLSVICCNK